MAVARDVVTITKEAAEMVNYREILRLSNDPQNGQRSIAAALHCSRDTIREVRVAAEKAGVSWPFVKMNDLKSARSPKVRDRKAFEESAFGRLWQSDTYEEICLDSFCLLVCENALSLSCHLLTVERSWNFRS